MKRATAIVRLPVATAFLLAAVAGALRSQSAPPAATPVPGGALPREVTGVVTPGQLSLLRLAMPRLTVKGTLTPGGQRAGQELETALREDLQRSRIF